MKKWQENKGWNYYQCDLDEKITDFPIFESIHQLWMDKRTDKWLPAWKDFEFEEFVGWHKHLILYEVTTQPFDLTYRIFSSFAADIYGKNYAGKRFSDPDFDIEDEYDLLHFKLLHGLHKVGLSTGPVQWFQKEYIKLSFLELPLSADGENITHFLSCMVSQTTEERPKELSY